MGSVRRKSAGTLGLVRIAFICNPSGRCDPWISCVECGLSGGCDPWISCVECGLSGGYRSRVRVGTHAHKQQPHRDISMDWSVFDFICFIVKTNILSILECFYRHNQTDNDNLDNDNPNSIFAMIIQNIQ